MKLDLAELKKRWQPRTVLAITIESGRIVIEAIHRQEKETKIVRSTSLAVRAETVLKDPEKVGAQLAEALAIAEIKERRCVVCVPPGWASSASTELPEVGAEDLRGYLELRAEKEFPIAASELRLAHCAYFLPDGTRRATLAAIPAKRLDSLEKMLAVAGCRAVSISLGLERCLEQPNAAVHFLANGDHVDVVITAGGGIAALRSFADVAPSEETPFDAPGFLREIRITLGRLPETIRKQVQTAHFEGPQAAAQALCRQTSEQLERMGITSPECGSSAVGEDPAQTTGLAAAAADALFFEKPLPFEFVVPEQNRYEALFVRYNTKRYRTIALFAAAIILLPIIAFSWQSHRENSLQSEWSGMQKNVGELEVLQAKLRQFHPWFNAAPESVQMLDGLIATFPDQGDVWAKSMQLSDGKITCTGFARTQPALMSMLDRLRSRKDVSAVQLQQIRGNNPIQFSFSYKWEPSHD